MATSDEEIESLLKMNIYGSKKDIVADAVRALLKSRPGLKIEIAIDRYKRRKASLWRASEIAGMAVEEFKEVLASRGIKIVSDGKLDESRKRIGKVLGA